MKTENSETIENKDKKSKSKKVALALVIILLLLIVAVSFAYYYAILKGENVNTSKMGGASLVYTEPETGTETEQMSDYEGIKNSTPYEFTVTGSATGSTILNYAIYLEELEGNTVNKENINYYLTDENDMPLSGIGSVYPENDANVIITPSGEEKSYNYYTDVSVKNGSSDELYTGQITNVDPYDYLLLYYAGSVLNLEEGDNFYIEIDGEEGMVCREATYNESDQVITFDYENIAESSNCTVSYDISADGYKIKSKSDESVLYTATFGNEYIEFADESNTKFNGDILSYIAKQQNVETNGSFYVKNAYTIQNPTSGELEEVGSYCMKYTKGEEYFDDELAEDSNCSNVYTDVVGSVYASTLGHLEQKIDDDNYSSISNIVRTDSIYFENGKATLNGKGDTYYEQRLKNPLRTYKLRYWISSNASDTTGNTATEATSTTDGKSHTVNFGGNGVFKFKVNVYAYQESYGQFTE